LPKIDSKAKATIAITLIIAAAIGANCIQAQRTVARTTPYLFKARALNAVSTITGQVAENDTNWAGYIIASNLQNPQPTVAGVSASWTVPSVSPSNQTEVFSAIWIGIGGFFDNTLIQVGTEQDSIGGQPDYSAWYELLPQFAITIHTITISPGDQMNASIQLANSFTGAWSIYLKDLTTNQTFQNYFIYPASQLSAEWVVERPLVPPRLTVLANIGSVTFTNCSALVGTQSSSISTFPTVQSIMYDSVKNATGITQLTAVSDLSPDGSSFTVETSPSAIPEMSAWAIFPLTIGTSLLAVALKKRQPKKKEETSIDFIE